MVNRSHTVSRVGESVLNLHLAPWPMNLGPPQTDYGLDGDVTTTELMSYKLNPRVLPYSFKFQLKSTERTHDQPLPVRLKTGHLRYWLDLNVPVVLFLACVEVEALQGCVLWRIVDDALVAKLSPKGSDWTKQRSVTLRMTRADILDRNHKEQLLEAVARPKVPISPVR